jgi:hypothetical protein
MGLAVREATWEEFLAQVQKDDPCYLENKHLYDEGPKGRCFYLLEVD